VSQQINLYDARFRKQQRHFSAATLLQAGAAVLVLALAIQALYARQNRILQETLSQTEQRAAAVQEQALRFAKDFTAQSGGALGDEAVRLEERLHARRSLLATMQSGAGAHGEGFSPYLAALARRTMQGVWLTGVEIGNESRGLVIKGRVLSSELVPAYIGALNKEEPFAGRSVSELRLSAKAERYIDFSLSIPLAQKGPS
jgi:hypothetical protein